ncbi:MAG: OmpA family protein [Campylobacterota bacterium]|nr:OmpA family protein [Campylobacterota bacterium]
MSIEYAKLKSLLVQEEIDKIETLIKKIRALEENQQKDIVIEKLSNIITEILSKSLQNNQQKLYATLQPLISKGVIDELHRSTDLQKILFPIITSAIQEQVHEQKETIVDALYPIMGNMISKYVSSAFTDMMHEINNTLQSSLSFARVKRKIKSKLYGVSEAQLLLKETDFVDIETVFLIHKESGLLILDLHKEGNQKIEEVEMVASMLSAIRSFVNDWISSDQEMSEIREIEYSNSSITIESAGSCYLAVVTSNHADMKDKLSKVLARIVSKYSKELSEFDGDTSQLDMYNIKAILSTLFENNKDTTKDKFPLLGVLFMFVFLMLPIGWYGYGHYKSYKIEQNEQKITSLLKENNVMIYDLDVVTNKEGEVLINGIVLYQEDREKVDIVLRGYRHINQINSIDMNFKKNYKIELMKEIVNSINREYNANIEYEYYYDKIKFRGLIIDNKAKNNFIEKMEVLFNNEKLFYNIDVLPLLDSIIYFKQGSSKISNEYDDILDKLSDTIINNSNYYIKISGYTDTSGTYFLNQKISLKRVLRIKQLLMDKGVKEEMIIVNAIAKPPENIKYIQNKDRESLSRCVTFNWEIKDGE